MSKPSFSNIDLWLFELAEGNLNEQQVEELRIFLLQHPELDVEKDVWEMAKVEPVMEAYPDAHLLEKKEPSRIYFAVGSLSLLLLTFVGCYQFYGGFSNNTDNSASIVQNSDLHDDGNFQENYARNNTSGNNRSNTANANKARLLKQGEVSDYIMPVLRLNPLQFISGSSSLTFSPYNDLSRSLNRNFIAGVGQSEEEILNEQRDQTHSTVGTTSVKHKEELEIHKAKTIQSSDTKTRLQSVRRQSSTVSTAGTYKETFSLKLGRTMRKMQRMLDNPIALKNFRDPHYHVPGLTSNEINFGATGTMLRTRTQTLSRVQWFGQQNEQFVNTVSVDGYSYGMRGGIGVQLKHSLYNRGGLNTSEIAMSYSPKLSVNHFISIEPSVRFKMGNKLLNDDRMTGSKAVELNRGNVIAYYEDGSNPTGKTLWYKDLGAGLMVNTKWFFVGVQADNLFRHKDNIYSNDFANPRRADHQFIATAGTDWESKKENMTLSPYVVYINTEQLTDVWLGANFRLNWFNVGGAVSTNLEPSASVGMKFERFALHYNADYLTSMMTGKQELSHQLSLRFTTKPTRFGRKLLNL